MKMEELIFVTLYKIFDSKTSVIFREPVNTTLYPNYCDIIKEPMDIGTIIHKF